MKIASFNVNSLRARLQILLDWIKKESPDVLCLQETKVPDSIFPKKDFEKIGYSVVFKGEKNFNGVAILSNISFEEVHYGFEDGSESERLITAKIKKINIINTYVPQGFHPLSEKFREKLDWLQRLYYFFKEKYSPQMPIVWTGDFNIAPETKDVYDPELLRGHVGFHPDEHAVLKKFKEWGFVDVFRMHNTESGQYSFWDYTIKNALKKGIGWRIDHIWATRVIAEKSIRSWIDVRPRLLPKPSDHTPVIAEFNI
ncbi:MAG: exodeoxyribonuclease III [Thermodesulfovibrionales bacterium]